MLRWLRNIDDELHALIAGETVLRKRPNKVQVAQSSGSSLLMSGRVSADFHLRDAKKNGLWGGQARIYKLGFAYVYI